MRKQYFNIMLRSFMALTALLFITSCKSDKKELCSIKVATLAGTYKLTAMKYRAGSTAAEQDFFAYMDDCEKDDLITLKPDGTSVKQDAGTVCSPRGDDTGNWMLNGNVISSDDADAIDGTIESFDCSTLVVFSTDIYRTGDRLTVTLKKQ